MYIFFFSNRLKFSSQTGRGNFDYNYTNSKVKNMKLNHSNYRQASFGEFTVISDTF